VCSNCAPRDHRAKGFAKAHGHRFEEVDLKDQAEPGFER
jgi:hypothetical protein